MNKLSRRFRQLFAKSSRRSRQRRTNRWMQTEQLEGRVLLAGDLYHNELNAGDVNNDGYVVAGDVVKVVNALNNSAAGVLAEGGSEEQLFLDTSGDGQLSALDALIPINMIQAGEGENPAQIVSYEAMALASSFITAPTFGGFSFVDNGANDSIVIQGSGRSWLDAGFAVGGQVLVSNSGTFVDTEENPPVAPADRNLELDTHIHNNGIFDIVSVDATTLTVAGNLTTEFPANVRSTDSGGNPLAGQDIISQSAQFFRPVASVSTGSDFFLGMVVQDLRTMTPEGQPLASTSKGVFSATVDVDFDTTEVAANGSVDSDIILANNFSTRSRADGGVFGTAGLINEAGASAFGAGVGVPTGGNQQLLWRTSFTAGSSATTALLATNASDVSPANDTLLFGINTAIPASMIDYRPLNLDIVSDIVARDDNANGQAIATVDEGTGRIEVNVLANDEVFVPVGGTPTIQGVTQPNIGSADFTTTSVGFTPPASVSAPTDAVFTYTINNGQGATATGTVTVRVNPVNDPPVNTVPGSQTIDEDNDLAFSAGAFSISDADGNVNVTVDLSSSLGTVSVPAASGVTINNSGTSLVSLEGSVSDVNNALNSVTYSPDLNANGSGSLTVTTSDGIESDVDTVSISITAINDAPVNTVPGPQTVFNTVTLPFTGNAFQVSDVDASTLEVSLTVSQGTLGLTTTTGLTLSGNNSGSLTASGTASNLNNALNSLVYDPVDTFIGDDTLTMTTSDLGGTGNGGTLTDTDTVTISVTPPMTPFAASNSYTADEGTSAFTLSPNPLDNDIVFAGGSKDVTDVSIVSAQGSLSFSGGSFTYTPPADVDFFGTETFTYTLEDSTTPLGDDNDGPSTGTITIDIQPVNDAPINSIGGAPISGSATVNGTEDTTLSFSGSNGLTISDIDAGTGSVTVTLTVNSGALNVSSTSGVQGNGSGQLTIDGSVSQVNSALGGLTYSPNLNFFGTDPLTINTNDNGNTGASAATDNDTVNITISPVNDAPTIVVPGQQTFFTDFDNRFSSDPAPFSVSDVDADGDDVQVDLTIGDGTLTISSTSGVTVTQNPGGTNGVRLTGAVADVNTALASGVDYRTTVDGDKTLTATVNDLGNNGSGGAQSDSGTVNIEVLDFIPVDLDSQIFTDMDGDNTKDSGEIGVGGVDVVLSGTNFRGETVNLTAKTNADGTFSFNDLQPNQPGQPYVVTQSLPAFFQANGSSMSIDINLQGQAQVSGGLSTGNLKDEFADIWSRFVFGGGTGATDKNSGVVFGIENGVTSFASVDGPGWNTAQYSNFRFAASSDGDSGVLTVFDSTAGVDRTANVSVAAGTLSHHGVGVNRIYRVVGGSSLLAALPQGQPEGESNDDVPVDASFAAAADDIFSRFG